MGNTIDAEGIRLIEEALIEHERRHSAVTVASYRLCNEQHDAEINAMLAQDFGWVEEPTVIRSRHVQFDKNGLLDWFDSGISRDFYVYADDELECELAMKRDLCYPEL